MEMMIAGFYERDDFCTTQLLCGNCSQVNILISVTYDVASFVGLGKSIVSPPSDHAIVSGPDAFGHIRVCASANRQVRLRFKSYLMPHTLAVGKRHQKVRGHRILEGRIIAPKLNLFLFELNYSADRGKLLKTSKNRVH